MLKQSQKRTKRAALIEELMSSTPAKKAGWLATIPTGRPSKRAKPDQRIFFGIVLLHLEEVAVVDDASHNVLDVIGLVALGGDDHIECLVGAVDGVGRLLTRRVLQVVGGQEAEQLANHRKALGVVMRQKVSYAALAVVRRGAAELVFGDLFVSDGLDHVRARDEHVTGLVDHQDKVGHSRRVDGAAGTRSHDGRDLRHHAGTDDVAQEDVRVAPQRANALLDAGAAGIVQPNDRRTDLHRLVHDLDDLGSVGLAERAAEDGEVLGEDEHQTTLNASVAGDKTVAVDHLLVHAELESAMSDKLVGLFEGSLVEQKLNPLASGHFAELVFSCATRLAAASLGQSIALVQECQFRFVIHDSGIISTKFGLQSHHQRESGIGTTPSL